jgi:hypothetical protein
MARTTCSEVTLKCRAISAICQPQFSIVAALSSNVLSESMPVSINTTPQSLGLSWLLFSSVRSFLAAVLVS